MDAIENTEAYVQLVGMAKHQYHAMVKYRKIRKDFDFKDWLVKYLDRKADIVLSFYEPRDWGIKEGLVSAAEKAVTKWKNKGVLKLP